MKYIVDNKHREFFDLNGWVEFEELLTADKIEDTREAIQLALIQRLAINAKYFDRYSSRDLYVKGRDLWRDNEIVKGVVCYRTLAEITSNLVGVSPIRLAYDQVFMTGGAKRAGEVLQLDGVGTLNSCSSFQGLLCGLLIALTNTTSEMTPQPTVDGVKVAPLPKVAGSGVYLAPDVPIDFTQLLSGEEGSYLLIAYCKAVAVVTRSERDPHAHALKTFGYGFGDKLTDIHHPVLYR